MTEANEQRPQWLDDETLGAVRPAVRDMLLSSPAFRQLSPDEQRALAATMVRVSAYMANPDGVATEAQALPETTPLAQAQADPVQELKGRLADDPGFAGADFEGGAIAQGTEQFGRLVRTVDFPAFVSGLIENVFQAIVDSSIQQMRAYGELLANVAKSVDEYARDNITLNNARDWLVQSFPGELSLESSDLGMGFAEGDGEAVAEPRVAATGEDPEASARRVSERLNITPPISDLSDEAQEARLVQEARLAIARSRQQLLASMVMLGINRIVVTDGLIDAKVVFDLRARDVASRKSSASMADREAQRSRAGMSTSYGGWFSPVKASAYAETQTEHVATVSSSVDEESDSRAELKARLSGAVRVNFKSDYMPMEKLATPEMIAAIQGNAEPRQPLVEGA